MDNKLFNTTSLIILGCLFISLSIGGFIIWSTTTKLSSASIASGTLVVETQRKKIQHLDGGWVKAIHVKEGQKVKSGDLLLELANSQVQSDYYRYLQRTISLQAQKDRLTAAINDKDNVLWTPMDNPEYSDVEYQKIIQNQQLQHQQTQLQKQLQQGQYQQKKLLIEGKLKGTDFQIKAVDQQLALLSQELEMLEGLLKKGYVSKTRVMALQRTRADSVSDRAKLSAERETLSRQVTTIKQDFTADKVELKQQYTESIVRLNKELRDVQQALSVAKDTKDKVMIRSEHDGTVVDLSVHSIGGVVRAGDVLMEIVPDSDNLLIEAIVKSEDIDMVRQGLEAKVRLSAYSIRKTAPVSGKVIYVAADRIPKNNKGESGYRIKVQLDTAEVENLKHVQLYPGMPTEVFILLQERTLWDYFTAPLVTSYYKAFREA